MQTTLVLMEPRDAAELASLEAACFSTPWSAAQYEKILTPTPKTLPGPDQGVAPPAPFSTATPVFGLRAADGDLVAYLCIAVHWSSRELEIYTIAVREDCRRKGLAHKLLGSVLPLARDKGLEQCYLEVRQSNEPAIALYASFGFAQYGVRKKYYTQPVEDALVMAADLRHMLLCAE